MIKYIIRCIKGDNYPKHRKTDIAAYSDAIMVMSRFLTQMGQF